MKHVMNVIAPMEQLELVRVFCKGLGVSVSKPRDIEEYKCVDCKEVSDNFMVHNSVWRIAGYGPRENSCLRCLEIRLGRRLCKSDFKDLPINRLALHSYQT